MAMDTRAYITVADEFPEHPKTLELSDAAFRAVVELWCFSNRRRTDGDIPTGMVRRYDRKVIEELIEIGFMVRDGKKHSMHDYLKHQKSAKKIDELMTDRTAAGKRGGIKSNHTRNHVNKQIIDPNCELCPGEEPDEHL